ncbi:MAG: hydrogenase maturation nickel metallochaperone HypA [Micrococcales bacterium]|nr:hydrogenase maturation nickel metallochaperone HypA [Micrococcales bacterium]
MHELGLLRSVVTAVEKAAGEAGATGVQAVGLQVGTLSGALPEALEGAWPIATAHTVVDGARLEIETVPAAVWCPTCAAEQPVDEYYTLTCPACGTPSGALVRGRELAVTFADLDIPGHD